MEGNVSTTIAVDNWQFEFAGGICVEVENMSRPYGRRHIQCPPDMRHSDVEMFARGWVAAMDNATNFSK